MISSLENIRVLDLSRVLAGPVCTQMLSDLGAEIIKIERPGEGDDTRRWGPPFLRDAQGNETSESAYYLSCNRGKKSVTVDVATPEGQKIIHALAAKSDILIHNFKVGGLDKFGLGFEAMHTRHPHLIYTAISGFGQTGPLATEPGYDLLSQAMGGLMAHTGADGTPPMKAGIAITDIMTGLYAAIGTLSALNARHQTGKGQMVDVALLDVTLAAMTNIAQYYLTGGTAPQRYGNAHATIVPYQAFAANDGHFVLAIGNDAQFRKLCQNIDQPDWADDPAYATNQARLKNREALISALCEIFSRRSVSEWVALFRDVDLPAAPVNRIDQVFAEEQIKARGMEITQNHPLSPAPLSLVGSPLKLSATPVRYQGAPPTLGQNTHDVLKDVLGLSLDEILGLKERGIV